MRVSLTTHLLVVNTRRTVFKTLPDNTIARALFHVFSFATTLIDLSPNACLGAPSPRLIAD